MYQTIDVSEDEEMLECHRGHSYHRESMTNGRCPHVSCITEFKLEHTGINVDPDLHPSWNTESMYESGTLDMISHSSDPETCWDSRLSSVEEETVDLVRQFAQMELHCDAQRMEAKFNPTCPLFRVPRGSPVVIVGVAVVLLLLFLPGLRGLTVTICQCAKPRQIGVVDLGKYTSCSLPRNNTFKTTAVNYTVLENRDTSFIFGGHVCKQTQKAVRVEGFYGETDTVYTETAVTVAPSDCRRMIETRICNGNPMLKDGNVWRFDGTPQVTSEWWRVVESHMLNCLFESITMESTCNSCPVKVVMGELTLNRTVGHSTRGRLTFIWGLAEEKDKSTKCITKVMYEGTGEFLDSTQSGSGKDKYRLRLRDTHTQLDFMLCRKVRLCAEQDEVYEVLNHNETYVTLNVQPKKITRPPTNLGGVPKHTASYLSSHLQFIENRVDYTEQRMAVELADLACIVDNARLSLLFSLSRSSPLLAGKALGQPVCYVVDSFGDTAFFTQCEVQEVEMGMKNTSCGPQPWFQGPFDTPQTIDKDGFTARTFASCLWRSGIASFNGESFIWRDGRWQLMLTTNRALQKHLQRKFKIMADNLDEQLSSHFAEDPYRFLDLTAELSGLMAEQGAHNLSMFLDSAPVIQPKVATFTILLDYVKARSLFIILAAVVFVAIGCLIRYRSCFAGCFSVCRRTLFRSRQSTYRMSGRRGPVRVSPSPSVVLDTFPIKQQPTVTEPPPPPTQPTIAAQMTQTSNREEVQSQTLPAVTNTAFLRVVRKEGFVAISKQA